MSCVVLGASGLQTIYSDQRSQIWNQALPVMLHQWPSLRLFGIFGQMNSSLEQTDGMLTTERIPIILMKPYLNHGYTLYVDNFILSTGYNTSKIDKGRPECYIS